MPKTAFSKLSLPARTGITVGVTLLFALVACLAIAAVMGQSEDPTAHLTLCGEVAFLLSMLLCGFLGASLATENRFVSGILPAGVMLLLVIAASIAFGGESFVKEAVLATLGAFAASLGSLLGAREKKRKRRRG